MLNLQITSTQAQDLNYVLATERDHENRQFIIPWPLEKHRQALSDPDMAHLIVQDQVNVGYVILAGLLNPNQSLELRRLVITDKGKGYGKATIEQIKKLTFETYQAHRLWLDVKPDNYRAQTLYQQAGFVIEGTLRECLKTNNQYESLIIMSMLKQEYQNQQMPQGGALRQPE